MAQVEVIIKQGWVARDKRRFVYNADSFTVEDEGVIIVSLAEPTPRNVAFHPLDSIEHVHVIDGGSNAE